MTVLREPFADETVHTLVVGIHREHDPRVRSVRIIAFVRPDGRLSCISSAMRLDEFGKELEEDNEDDPTFWQVQHMLDVEREMA